MKLLLSATMAVALSVTPALSVELDKDHRDLIQAAEDHGASVYMNAPPCYMKDASGLYAILPNVGPAIVICQDNKEETFQQVEWTENDLDTLRHESWHYVQDCLDGNRDGLLLSLHDYDDELTFGDIVESYGLMRSARIEHTYAQAGVDPKQIRNEIEAFHIAEELSAKDIARVLRAVCPAI